MKSTKKKRLETKGWKVGTVAEFLELSPEESAYIEMKLALSKNLQERRKDKSLTQEQLARLLKSSQSRVAKMETGDPSVSLDLLVRSLLILGESRESLAKSLCPSRVLYLRVRPSFFRSPARVSGFTLPKGLQDHVAEDCLHRFVLPVQSHPDGREYRSLSGVPYTLQ